MDKILVGRGRFSKKFMFAKGYKIISDAYQRVGSEDGNNLKFRILVKKEIADRSFHGGKFKSLSALTEFFSQEFEVELLKKVRFLEKG